MANPNISNVLFLTDSIYTIANNGAARIYVTDDNPPDGTTATPGGSGSNSLSYTVNIMNGGTINFNMLPINPLSNTVLMNISSTGNVIAPAMGAQGWSGQVMGSGTDTLTLTYYCQNSSTAYTAAVQFSVAC